jgi:hypothetical protein
MWGSPLLLRLEVDTGKCIKGIIVLFNDLALKTSLEITKALLFK